jgi:phosphoglucomutase
MNGLPNVVDMEVTRAAGVELGVDPLGGAAQRIVDNALF